MSKHIGSNFDDFLAQDGALEEATATAVKRVISWQLAQAMKAQHISKTEMAARMRTSRVVVNRLLDEADTGVTLATLARASVAVGVPLRFELARAQATPSPARARGGVLGGGGDAAIRVARGDEGGGLHAHGEEKAPARERKTAAA